jgi:hypothetical protein
VLGDYAGLRDQIIANATIISPNIPTAMMVFVVVSIVDPAGSIHRVKRLSDGPPHSLFRCRLWRTTAWRNLFRMEETCDHSRNIVSRDTDVLEQPVVQTAQRVDGAISLPAPDRSAEELRDADSWRVRRRGTMSGFGWMFEYGHFVPPYGRPSSGRKRGTRARLLAGHA